MMKESTKFNLNNKQFLLVDNSAQGKVNSETQFHYKQRDGIVTADYFGGGIKSGKILAHFIEEHILDMRYQCITEEDEFKCGKALVKVSHDAHGKIILNLDWEWIGNKNEKGHSKYIEF